MLRFAIVFLLVICSASNLTADDYTFSTWRNGWRKNENEISNDIFGIETNKFGFTLDLDDFKKAGFSRWQSGLSYEAAVQHSAAKLRSLPPASLHVEIEADGTKYVANACQAGLDEGNSPLSYANLFESGRHTQHYRFEELDFRSSAGKRLSCEADLSLVAWSDSLTFNLTASPFRPYQDGVRAGVAGNGLAIVKKPIVIKHRSKFDNPVMSLETWVKIPKSLDNADRKSWIVCKNGLENFDGNFGFRHYGSGAFAATMNIGGGKKHTHVIRSRFVKQDQWNYLAMTYDGAKMVFYINGKKVGEKNINKTRKPRNGPLIIGNSVPGNIGDRTFKGLVDQVRIWNHAFDAKQIARLNRDRGQVVDKKRPGANRRMVSEEGLVLREDFEDRGESNEMLTLKNVKVRLALSSQFGSWEKRAVIKQWVSNDAKTTTLTCDFSPPGSATNVIKPAAIRLVANGQPAPVIFNQQKNCYSAHVGKLNRKWKAGYTDIREYDEFQITVPGSDATQPLPFLLHLSDVANITGVCPILCQADGTPTGIPVQLSKNWHDETVGNYLMAYTKIPAAKTDQTYLLRLAYGFYGTLPSATHSQLSLVGYGNGNNGRWDQLAIGCFGETICFDMDMSCVENSITDIRLLMARNGANDQKWGWTDAGWGGDWLNIAGNGQKKLFQKEMKTAYLSHGPCLTDAKHSGVYGASREVRFQTQIQTLRTDDYNRSFQNFRYDFDKNIEADEASIFKLGKSRNYTTPEIAYGNANGLIKQQTVPGGLKEGYIFISDTTFSGPGPWWVAFPGGRSSAMSKGTGYKALIIRKFEAVVNGRKQTTPTFRAIQYKSKNSEPNLDFELLVAGGKPGFKQGDFVDMELELITLTNSAEDYYGPNEAFQKHLQANPSSWKTTFREAQQNNLQVSVARGQLIRSYPISIEATAPEVTVDIRGGVGAVPISFSGLDSATGHTLYRLVDGKRQKFDQAVHGNDFWQTDFDPSTKTYKLTFNLPLDSLNQSQWVLVSKPQG